MNRGLGYVSVLVMIVDKAKCLSLLHPAKLIGTWFGSGLAPKASGTAGTLAALPFAWGIQAQWGSHALFVASILAFFIGWLATHSYLKHTDAKDPKEIVIDEVAGVWLLLSFLYVTWESYLIGFICFRFFDVLKPWPVSWADNAVKGALGVMFDDILAAAYPLVLVALFSWLGSLAGHPVNLMLLRHWLGG